jgi:hypothetical protein
MRENYSGVSVGEASAHRIVRVSPDPATRTIVLSANGRYGNRSGQRLHEGSNPTAAAVNTPYAGRAAKGTGG